jgi:lipopolysaccharide export system protein LptA
MYSAVGEKIIFTGEPKAVEGENVVTGKKMTYLMNEDRFLVEGSKVFFTNKKEQ